MKNEQDTARQIIKVVEESARGLDQRTVARLDHARHQAVARMQAQEQTAGPAGLGRLLVDYIRHHRVIMPTAMLCGAVLLAFMVTQQFTGEGHEQGDAFLLASDLPPEAYLDQGFDEWLERTSQF